MGKAHYKKRIRSARHHANGLHANTDSTPDPTSQEAIEVSPKLKKKKNQHQQEREVTIAVLDKISSPSSHDRIWSLAAISNLVLSSQSIRQLFLSKNLVRLLIDRLNQDEDQYDVLVEVTGVLRNLVIEGGKDVCGEMANKGILLPLNSLVSKILTSITDFVTQVNNRTGDQYSTVQSLLWTQVMLLSENVVIVLLSLAETSNKWLVSVGALDDIIPLLSTVLKLFSDNLNTDPAVKSIAARYTISSSCALGCGQCLYTLTEDHPRLARELISPDEESIQPLISLFESFEEKIYNCSDEDNENLELLQVVSVGILRNIILHTKKRAQTLSFRSAYDEKIPQILTTKLNVNLLQLAKEAAEANQNVPTPPLSDINIAKASFQEPSQAEVKLESIERRLTIVQLSLELVGEWCASADGFECDDDDDADSNGVSVEDDNAQLEMTDVSNSGENEDVEMEQAPTAVAFDSAVDNQAANLDSIEQESDAMEVEQSRSFLRLSHAALFSSLLDQLRQLAQPTTYLYQSPASQVAPKETIPTATNMNGVTCVQSDGTLSDLLNELLSSIHLRATDALNNMLITLDRLEGNSEHFVNQFISNNKQALSLFWDSCWSAITELFRHAHSSRKGKQKVLNGSAPSHENYREQLLTSNLTCLWSLTRILLRPQAPLGIIQITTNHSQRLMDILRSIENETLKCRALSTLICFASRPSVPVDENSIIGDLLLEIISSSNASNKDVPHSLLLVALDGVFDVYADETRDYDEPVFQQRKFLENLKAAVPKLQVIVKKIDKRKHPILRQQAEEVQSNLIAFVQYRKSLTS